MLVQLPIKLHKIRTSFPPALAMVILCRLAHAGSFPKSKTQNIHLTGLEGIQAFFVRSSILMRRFIIWNQAGGNRAVSYCRGNRWGVVVLQQLVFFTGGIVMVAVSAEFKQHDTAKDVVAVPAMCRHSPLVCVDAGLFSLQAIMFNGINRLRNRMPIMRRLENIQLHLCKKGANNGYEYTL